MRRNRRSGNSGHEFGGSGEDSFVAVVVTKLTGALLFILLLTMVIMALLPKAIDLPPGEQRTTESAELTITTPETLPEAIAGRPYNLALAATGGSGKRIWTAIGELPSGLTLDGDSGLLHGTPRAGTPKPAEIVVRVSDGEDQAARSLKLLVYQSDKPLSTPAWWKPGLPPVPWRAWVEQGFGFLLIWLIHLVGMNALGSLARWSNESLNELSATDEERITAGRRFAIYRFTLRLASLTAAAILAIWLWRNHA